MFTSNKRGMAGVWALFAAAMTNPGKWNRGTTSRRKAQRDSFGARSGRPGDKLRKRFGEGFKARGY